MSNILQFLKSSVIPPALVEISHLVIATLNGEVVLKQGEGTPQSSTEFAKIYVLRRDIGYFGKNKVYGLNETIALLGSADRAVSLSYVQVATGLVSVWRETKDQSICGLLLIQPEK